MLSRLTWMSKLVCFPMFLSWKMIIGRRIPSVSSGSRGHVMNVDLRVTHNQINQICFATDALSITQKVYREYVTMTNRPWAQLRKFGVDFTVNWQTS